MTLFDHLNGGYLKSLNNLDHDITSVALPVERRNPFIPLFTNILENILEILPKKPCSFILVGLIQAV